MSVTETNKIDIVGTRPDSQVVRLVITDHLEWSDFQRHAELLQAKVNTYLEFVESGQMQRTTTPPMPIVPQVEILLAAQHAPSDEAWRFLAQVARFLEGEGIGFNVEVK